VEDVAKATAVVLDLLERHPAIDGLVCVSDSLALGAMIAAASVGRADLPIIGFDNTPLAQALGFSSVEQGLELVASGVLELLMGATGSDLIGRTPSPGEAHRLITPQLVVRRPNQLPIFDPSRTDSQS
jgi:DNA-binding LacI/PurR family transcriptional regulator